MTLTVLNVLESQSQSDSQHLVALILLLTFPRAFPLSQNTTSHNMRCDNGEVLKNVIELTLICCQKCTWLHALLKRSYYKVRMNKPFLQGSVSQPLSERGPLNSFFLRRGPGPNKFTRKYFPIFIKFIH